MLGPKRIILSIVAFLFSSQLAFAGLLDCENSRRLVPHVRKVLVNQDGTSNAANILKLFSILLKNRNIYFKELPSQSITSSHAHPVMVLELYFDPTKISVLERDLIMEKIRFLKGHLVMCKGLDDLQPAVSGSTFARFLPGWDEAFEEQ